MDTRRLYSFVKIVGFNAGSITRAADILHIAQPALSQQLSMLESHFKQQLLIRSKRGVGGADRGGPGAVPARPAHPAPGRAGAGRRRRVRAGARGQRLGGPGPVQHGRGARAAAAHQRCASALPTTSCCTSTRTSAG